MSWFINMYVKKRNKSIRGKGKIKGLKDPNSNLIQRVSNQNKTKT